MHNEKAKLVNEQVLDHAKCTSYKKRLSTPVINDTVIKKAYQDAMQAGCINKDI